MTAVPNPSDFLKSGRMSANDGALTRPNVTEHFWGYEVCPNEQIVDIAVFLRLLCGVLAVATVAGAMGIWLFAGMGFIAQTTVAKAVGSGFLICLSMILTRIAARGTQVRVQVDTSAGELREVVTGPFGSNVVLAQYGFDTVQGVELVGSRGHRAMGQICIEIKGGAVVPVGDGALVVLSALRDRLANDCGHDKRSVAREAIWSGPIPS